MESIHLEKSSQQTFQYTFAFQSVNFCDEGRWSNETETQLSSMSYNCLITNNVRREEKELLLDKGARGLVNEWLKSSPLR